MDPDHAYILIGLCPQLLWSCVWGRTYMLLSHSQIWVTSRFWDWLSHLNNQLSKTTQFSHKSNPKYPLSHQRSFLDSWPCSHMQMCIALCTYWKVFSSVVLFDPHISSCRYGQIIFLFSLMKNWGHREGQSIVLLKTNAGLETRSQFRVLLQHPTASFVLKELESALARCETTELKRSRPSKSFLLPTCNRSSSLNSEPKCLEVSSSLLMKKWANLPWHSPSF